MWPFTLFLLIHVTTGAVGLVLFWVPVAGKKGAQAHRRFGKIFANLMLVTASMAFCMGTTTLLWPLPTHPRQVALGWSAARIAGVFGWMMMYLAILTLQLVWHSRITVTNKKDHAANRAWPNVTSNLIVIGAALTCAYRGWLIHETLMMGIAIVGVASGLTNLIFIYRDAPSRLAYQLEHVKSAVGAGISVYTAFMAFGFVRLMPTHALNPKMWAIPLVIGLTLIIWHQSRIRLSVRRSRPAPARSLSASAP